MTRSLEVYSRNSDKKHWLVCSVIQQSTSIYYFLKRNQSLINKSEMFVLREHLVQLTGSDQIKLRQNTLFLYFLILICSLVFLNAFLPFFPLEFLIIFFFFHFFCSYIFSLVSPSLFSLFLSFSHKYVYPFIFSTDFQSYFMLQSFINFLLVVFFSEQLSPLF